MSTTRDCKHGRLARSCEICELEGKVEDLGVGLSIARKIIHRYRTETPPGYQPHMIADKVDHWLLAYEARGGS